MKGQSTRPNWPDCMKNIIIAPHSIDDEKVKRISSAVSLTKELLGEASAGANEYGGALSEASSKLAMVSKDDFKEMVGGLIGETQKMQHRTMELQKDLAAQQNEMENLRSELAAARQAINVDGLTGIGNRRCFDQALDEWIEKSRSENTPLGLLMIDVDHFKAFNDVYGHQIGDIVLRLIASLLTQLG